MTTEVQSFYTLTTSTHLSHVPAAMDELVSKYSSTMNTSTLTSSRNQRRNPIQRFIGRVCLEYYHYEVTFGLYVMTPGEKLVANTFVIVVMTLLLWALFFYLPSLLYHKLDRLVWLLTGHSGEEVSAVLGILNSHGNAISPVSIAENALPS